jgi:hypothetical protein
MRKNRYGENKSYESQKMIEFSFLYKERKIKMPMLPTPMSQIDYFAVFI